jgi:hypothetical protein
MHGTAQCVFRVQQSEEQLDSVRDEVVASRPVLESDWQSVRTGRNADTKICGGDQHIQKFDSQIRINKDEAA